MPKPQAPARRRERARQIRRPVVGHHALRAYALARKPRERALEKADRVGPLRSREDLGVGESARVVDADVDMLPTDPAHAGAPIAVNAMPDAADAPETLDVDVEELAGRRAFVAVHRRGRSQRREPSETHPA